MKRIIIIFSLIVIASTGAYAGDFDLSLKKCGVKSITTVDRLEINPYEFEGHRVVVSVSFKKMLSRDSAVFYSGWTNLADFTRAPDEIIVTGIPVGTHFEGGYYAPQMALCLLGKGTIKMINGFGVTFNAPHFKWIAEIAKTNSPRELQRTQINRQSDIVLKMKNSGPKARPEQKLATEAENEAERARRKQVLSDYQAKERKRRKVESDKAAEKCREIARKSEENPFSSFIRKLTE
jgi:hypothetical protein